MLVFFLCVGCMRSFVFSFIFFLVLLPFYFSRPSLFLLCADLFCCGPNGRNRNAKNLALARTVIAHHTHTNVSRHTVSRAARQHIEEIYREDMCAFGFASILDELSSADTPNSGVGSRP